MWPRLWWLVCLRKTSRSCHGDS
ncbi:hypothetical protein E2C01_096526 [Portunus trituberculatus]|uniref:Uncharacterized protein n=1 Tax=Portunus trituberculatus TaxID=210409 RepID=A0A5B7K287_PORTR|nr:hypothetical protein [Portunus trituberculatus]